jgi:4-diphosphocytidyl-2-C-methyl-D-erythritol kinase
VECPAKLNLRLEVLGRRPDGFHEVRLLNTALELSDRLTVEWGGAGTRIECDDPEVPLGADNLCAKAAALFFAARPEFRRGVGIRIEKRVPVAGGLGGGSSNAAGTLLALDALTGAGLAEPELMKLGAELGSDVPFFLYHSPAWALGRGELLAKGPSLPDWTMVLVRFGFGVRAQWSYSAWDLTNPVKEDTFLSSYNREVPSRSWRLSNDLESVVFSRYPEVKLAKEALLDAGAAGALMSGSGPTVFGVFDGINPALEAAGSIRLLKSWEVVVTKARQGRIISVVME